MNAETEARLIDELHKSVSESFHREELISLMYEQIHDDADFCNTPNNSSH